MKNAVKNVAIATANAFVPGSGVLVSAGFELAEVCYQIAQVVGGMEEKASSIKTQRDNITEDTEAFRWVLDLLERVQNQDQLTEGLQKMIVKFQAEVKEYERVLDKFTKKNILKQLLFHKEMDNASDNARKTSKLITQRLSVECSIDGSIRHRSPSVQHQNRDQRYIDLVDSKEVMVAMSDPENQKELLAIMARMGRRDEASMEESGDQVISVMKEKLWANSSRSVRSEIQNLPDWFITEDEIEVDMDAIIGYGGDAKIYKAALTDGTPVAVKIFNENVAKSEKEKDKFNSMMKLWQRLSNYNNICRLYGACYFTAAPFVVMEYCDVGPLDKHLRQVGPNRYNVSLEILAQAAQGIAKMHSIGIVHGDLKCDNILITGTPAKGKVGDFDRSFDWIALKKKRLVNGTAADAGVEITDAIRYLAPECVEGKLPNTKSDVYSFGMTIYHAIVGKSPYSEITNDEELHACKLAHDLPKRDLKSISDDVWTLISHCCSGSPDQRPAMPKVVEALKALMEGVSPCIEALINTSVDAVEASDQDVVVNVDKGPNILPVLEENAMEEEPPEQQQPAKLDTNTPVKAAKVKWKGVPRSSKIAAVVVFLTFAAVAVAVGIVFGTSSSHSSSVSISTSISDTSTSTSPTPSPTPSATPTSTPTVTTTPSSDTVKPTVSTILDLKPYLTTTNNTMLWGVSVSATGTIFVSGIREIFTISSAGEAELYAGNSTTAGYLDDERLKAYLNSVYAITVASDDNIYFCDKNDNMEFVIRQIKDDVVSTLPAFTRTADMGLGIAVDSNGNVFTTVTGDNTLVKISSSGVVSTITTGTSNLNSPVGIAIDSSNNIYITENHRVLKFTSTGQMSVLAGTTTSGFANGIGMGAKFANPTALTVGSDGDLYIADSGNNCIRKLALSSNTVTTYAGVCTTETDDGNTTTFVSPRSIDVAPGGALYVADDIARIRKIL